jgi:hypothetical protein
MVSQRIDDDDSWRLISNDPTIDQQNHRVNINLSQMYPSGKLSGLECEPTNAFARNS